MATSTPDPSTETGAHPKYDFRYGPGTPYAHATRLIEESVPSRSGVIVDLGCGQAPVAERLQQLGFEYVGLDYDAEGVAVVQARGIDAVVGDLSDVSALPSILTGLADGRAVAAVLMLDVIEHLPRTADLLHALGEALGRVGHPPLVVSIPNAAHFDVGVRLLMGQFEMTETGLLDETHISFFTEKRLTESLESAGFREIARDDFRLKRSDQHRPAGHPALSPTSPMSQYLRELRKLGGDTQDVNQFVRIYQSGVAPSRTNPRPTGTEIEQSTPSLTVLLRTQATRMGQLEEALTCLAAQTVQDLEVLLLCHSVDSTTMAALEQLVESFAPDFASRTHIVRIDGGGQRGRPLNVGIARATGKAIAFLDDDDLVTADWAEAFIDVIVTHPGHVVRSVCASQLITRAEPGMGGYRAVERAEFPYPERFDTVRHVAENLTPFCSFAVSREAVTGLGIRFDEALPVLEDWDFLVQAALAGGVVDTRKPTAIYHRWLEGPSSADEPTAVWENTRHAVMMKLDNKPLLLPRGSASALRKLYETQGVEHPPQAVAPDQSEEIRALRSEVLLLDDGVQNWRRLAELRENEINRLKRIEQQPIVRLMLKVRRAFRPKDAG